MIYKNNLLLFVFVILASALVAQSSSIYRGQDNILLSPNESSQAKEFPIENDGPFLAFSVKSSIPIAGLYIRFSENGTVWTDWQSIENDVHAQEGEIGWTSALGFIEAQYQVYQVKASEPTSASIHFFNPQFTERLAASGIDHSTITSRSCTCPLPTFRNRSQWCPSGNCPEQTNPTITQVSHLIVHHSAGQNSSSDWAAVVRSIWNFHVNDRGWSDIGYNWLIAPSGDIFQGRGDNVQGAHFCGTNSKTMGVCMMGTYMTVLPTDTSIISLQKLLSWKACKEDIDPLGIKYHPSSGLMLHQISGHRDGCATACPGDAFYPTFPSLRQKIKLRVDNNCANIYAPAPLSAELQDGQPLLSWIDNSDNETGFLLERMEAGEADYTLLASLDPDNNSYLDETITEGIYYGYRLRSYNDQDTSMYSNEIWLSTGGVATENPFINNNTVSLFPNPTSNELTIELKNDLSGHVEIEVLTPDMKTIERASFNKTTFSQTKTIHLKNRSAGLYFIKITQGADNGMFRVLKTN